MNQYPPHVAALLEAARAAHDPTPEDMARVHAALQTASHALPDAQPADALAGSGSGGAGFSVPLWGKLVVGSALLVLGVQLAQRSAPAARTQPAPQRAADAQAAPEPSEPSVESAPEAASYAARAPEQEALARSPAPPKREPAVSSSLGKTHKLAVGTPRSTRAARVVRERASHDAPQSAQAPAQVAPAGVEEPTPAAQEEAATAPPALPSRQGELTLLRAALRSLQQDRPQQALEQLREHQQRYPSGALGSEREGLRALALCRTDPQGAGAAARDAFLRSYAQSPLAARVQRACRPLK